ncbi:Yap7 protein [Maudiozyma humilis]|uniref:Yap7 protein n=1 Tax=Maudiozyma humilis TaxID=51915 RepID=A0AAV5S035_MAUHU|nr:Yap7 protein [Kazachstania humilis]
MDIRSSYTAVPAKDGAALSTSSIHVSKNWVLPERLKPGRRPGHRVATAAKGANGSPPARHSALASSLLGSGPAQAATSDDQPASGSRSASNSDSNSPIQALPSMDSALSENYDIAPRPLTTEGASDNTASLEAAPRTGGDSVARRRKQNRDAQRAYRERKANRIHVLEDTVAGLRADLDKWQTRAASAEQQVGQVSERLESAVRQNQELWAQVEAMREELGRASAGSLYEPVDFNSPGGAADSNLQELIQNFTPMKATPLLKKRKTMEGGSALPDMSVWKPGSCGNCKADPNNRAFCKSIFKGNANPNSVLPPKFKKLQSTEVGSALPDRSVWKPGSCANCKADPNNKAFCKSIFAGNANPNSTLPPKFKKLESAETPTATLPDMNVWKPGSCANCKADPNNKAFCKSIFAGNANPNSTLPPKFKKLESAEAPSATLPDMNVWKPGSCANCKADPNNKAFCKSIFAENTNPNSTLPPKFKKRDISAPAKKTPCQGGSGPCCSGCKDKKMGAVQEIPQPQPQPQPQEPEPKTYMAITDTYQRIRKHMTSQYDNECLSKLQSESNKNTTLITVLEKIATNLEINGREVEIKSVERALDGLDRGPLK